MQLYEVAINKFIKMLRKRFHPTLIILSGSYAHGTFNEESDIDLRLVIRSHKKVNIKGLKFFESFLFSYIIRDSTSFKTVMDSQFNNHSKFEARILSTGKVLFDNKLDTHLLEYAEKIMTFNFDPISKGKKRMLQMNIYSHYEKLLKMNFNSDLYSYCHFSFLSHMLHEYMFFLGLDFVLDTRLDEYLNSSIFREIHRFKEIPDKEFVKLFCTAVRVINKKSATDLYKHIEQKIGKLNFEDVEIEKIYS